MATDWSHIKVAIVGAGYMGMGIAQVVALAGAASVTVADTSSERASAAVEAGVALASSYENRGLLRAGAARIVRGSVRAATDTQSAVRDADLVFEAIVEDVDVKGRVLQEIGRHAPETSIIATNTSSISIQMLSRHVRRPERFVGIHFFNPAPFVPCVEVIHSGSSDEQLLDRLVLLLQAAGKRPVVLADSPGFIANRLQFALFREASLMVEEGVASPSMIDSVVQNSFGYRLPFYGPFAIADMAGLDVYLSAFEQLEESLGPRFSVPSDLRRLVGEHRLGSKSGEGYFAWQPDSQDEVAARRDARYVSLEALTMGEAVRPPAD